MAYSGYIAERIRKSLASLSNIEEKKMIGGLTFMYNNKMCVGVLKDELMCRVAPELLDELVKKNGCRTMDFTKRPTRGYILIEESGMKSDKEFNYWISLALDFNKFAKSSKKKRTI